MSRSTSATPLCAVAGAILALFLSPHPGAGQVGLAAHAGTLGVGGDIAVALGPSLAVRGRVGVQPWEPSHAAEDVDLSLSMQSPTFAALVDVFPGLAGLRVTGGVIHFSDHITLLGVPTQDIELNGVTYEASAVGTVSGRVLTKQTVPYLGVGWGNPARAGRLGFMLDLGVGFQGDPQIEVGADGLLGQDASFVADLQAEVDDIEGDIELFRFYPVLTLGLSFGT